MNYPDTSRTLAARAAITALSDAWLTAAPNSPERQQINALLAQARQESYDAHFDAWKAAQ